VGNVVEYQYPADKLTYTADGAITGGQLVELTGDRTVQAASADSLAVVGVAQYDAADGDPVGIASKGVYGLTASGAISAGDLIVAAASGAAKAIPAASATYVEAEQTIPSRVIGIALEDIANAAVGRVKVRL
jgi:predicted RecA/RadA family phage recombinase